MLTQKDLQTPESKLYPGRHVTTALNPKLKPAALFLNF